jgi:hypothetical protein
MKFQIIIGLKLISCTSFSTKPIEAIKPINNRQQQNLHITLLKNKTEQGIIPNKCIYKKEDSYNCAGLAFQSCLYEGDMHDVETTLDKMSSIECVEKCEPYQYKFFYWPHELAVYNASSGIVSKSHPDFHIVSGQTDNTGSGPSLVISKNGRRPITAPRLPENYEPRNGDPYRKNDLGNQISLHEYEVITNLKRLCYCSDTLPDDTSRD